MGNLFALIPQIMKAVGLIDAVKGALANGENILTVLNRMGAEFIGFFTDVAKALFPGLTAEQQAAAGVTILDQVYVTKLQTALNRLKAEGVIDFGEALKTDGIYGNLTKAAVKAYQVKRFPGNEKQQDGWAGRLTNALIDLDLAILADRETMVAALESFKS